MVLFWIAIVLIAGGLLLTSLRLLVMAPVAVFVIGLAASISGSKLGLFILALGIVGSLLALVGLSEKLINTLVVIGLGVSVLGGAIAGVNALFYGNDGSSDSAVGATTSSTTVGPTAECPASWKLQPGDFGDNNRYFDDGVPEVSQAANDQMALDAAKVWVDKVREVPVLLAAAASQILNRQPTLSSLATNDGKCASADAKVLVAELQLAVARAKVTAEDAPRDGINSGVENGRVVSASQAGITGDTRAIKIVLQDGRTIWILGRCGNIVVLEKSPFPKGKTDQTTTTTVKPTTSTTVRPGTSTTVRVTTTVRQTTTTTVRVTTTRPPDTTVTTVPPTTTSTMHPPISESCQLNPNQDHCPTPPVGQEPQDNSTSGVNIGPTPGAPASPPPVPTPAPTPVVNTPAPAPTPSGTNSGSGSGSNTPGGSTCGTSCSGGGPTPAAPGTPPVVDSGSHTVDPGQPAW